MSTPEPVRLTPEEAAAIEHCPCGHNTWIQHSGVADWIAAGCDHCDCPRTEHEAEVAAVEAILNARLNTAGSDYLCRHGDLRNERDCDDHRDHARGEP